MNPSTAWGNVKMYFGAPGEDDTMSEDLVTMGYILEESLSFETEAGTVLELYEEGHILRDRLVLEPSVKINATIIGIPDETRKAFWDTATTGSGDTKKVAVKSMITRNKYSVKIAAEQVPGSETFEAPVCNVQMSPAYSSTQGWTANVVLTVIKGQTGVLFDFGIIVP